METFFKKWKKYNEIQLTKNKMDLNIRKMTNHQQWLEKLSMYTQLYYYFKLLKPL